MNPNWLPANIPASLSAAYIVRETARQILKDFSSDKFEFPENFDSLETEQALLLALMPVVSHLLETDKNRLMQIIYRVDLSESSLGAAISGLDANAASIRISALILHREAIKVLSRSHFSRG
jgi:hypothetical protein